MEAASWWHLSSAARLLGWCWAALRTDEESPSRYNRHGAAVVPPPTCQSLSPRAVVFTQARSSRWRRDSRRRTPTQVGGMRTPRRPRSRDASPPHVLASTGCPCPLPPATTALSDFPTFPEPTATHPREHTSERLFCATCCLAGRGSGSRRGISNQIYYMPLVPGSTFDKRFKLFWSILKGLYILYIWWASLYSRALTTTLYLCVVVDDLTKSPGPPFPPDHHQAGRGTGGLYIYTPVTP